MAIKPTSRLSQIAKKRPRLGTVFFLGLLGAFVVVLLSLGPRTIVQTLYGPIGGLILVVMVVEYLVLKSMDRTRVYELENLRLRNRNRDLARRLKEVKALLDETPAPDSPSRTSPEWRQRAHSLRETIGSET